MRPHGRATIVSMKKLYIIPFIFLLFLTAVLRAQTPCDGVTKAVFNTLFPSDTSDHRFYFPMDGIEASNGEYVGIGVRENQNATFDAFFYRLDPSGNLIADPKFITLNTSVLNLDAYVMPFDDDHHSLAQIREIFNSNGVSQGYFVSLTTQSLLSGYDVVMLRLDATGAVQASNILESEKDDVRSVDCLRRTDNTMVILAQYQNTQIQSNFSVFLAEVNPLSCAIISKNLAEANPDFNWIPFRIAPVNIGPASYAVSSRFDSAGMHFIGLNLFNNNLQPVNGFGEGLIDIKPNFSTEVPFPTGMVTINSEAYICGTYELNDGSDKAEPFLFKATFQPPVPFPVISWMDIVPTSGLFNNGMHFIDIKKSADNQLVVLGNTNGFSGNIQGAVLMKYTTGGSFSWGRQTGTVFNGVNYSRNVPVFVTPATDGGFLYGAAFIAGPNGYGRIYAMKSDPDGWLHDCNCLSANTPVFQSVIPRTYLFHPYPLDVAQDELVPNIQASQSQLPQAFCNQYNPANDCKATFSWQQIGNCNEFGLSGSGTGTPPLTYQWSFGSPNQNTIFVLPCPLISDNVCLTVTDATGCTASVCQQVQGQPDFIPPVITCPSDITANTDPGQCSAHLNPQATATDNCIFPLVLNYHILPGNGTNPNTDYPLGISTLVATAIDCFGNTSSCSMVITVQDHQAPAIICPPAIQLTVPVCDGGAIVNFNPPTVSDNCPGVSYVCNHQSGEFFDCGNHVITCTATDQAGNTKSCNTPVNITCTCGKIGTSFMACTADPYVYQFTINVQDLSGAASCQLNLTGPAGISNVSYGPFLSGVATITGNLTVTDPIPADFDFSVALQCICASGNTISCDLPVNISTVCCKKIEVTDQFACRDAPDFHVAIVTPTTGTLHNIARVQWYIKSKTGGVCPAGPWGGQPYQDDLSSSLTDLILYPPYLSGDICYYAVVTLSDGPCTRLVSNIACVSLCEPSTCTIPDQEYCYTGTPVTPAPMTLQITQKNPSCLDSWAWTSPADLTVQVGGMSYTPTQQLTPSDPSTDCYEDFFYTVVLNDLCGQHFCQSRVRLWNDAAQAGNEIVMDPFEPQPFCPGEDATLVFHPKCTAPTENWHWSISHDGVLYNPLPGAGSSNTLWNTNRLYQDTWYQVETQNGICPPHQTGFFIDVADPFQLQSFQASYNNPCSPSGVHLSTTFSPAGTPDCPITVSWYKDGFVIFVQSVTGNVASYTYLPDLAQGETIGGNYYCVIKRSCCGETIKSPVIKVPEPPFIKIAGPCFLCNHSTADLEAVLINMSSADVVSYQWTTTDGDIIGSDQGSAITAGCAGTYMLAVTTTNGCIYTDQFVVVHCINNSDYCGIVHWVCHVGIPELANELPGYTIQPNPATDEVNILFDSPVEFKTMLEVLNMSGQTELRDVLPAGSRQQRLDISALPSGPYLLKLQNEHGSYNGRIFIKQK